MRTVLAFFGAISVCIVGATSGLAQQSCPFEDALEWQFVMALKSANVTDQQLTDLQKAGEIKTQLPQICIDEIRHAAANPDAECQRLNGQAVPLMQSYLGMAVYNFWVTGDAPALRRNIRAILRTSLNSVPHRCWFQSVAVTNGGSGNMPPNQCAQLRANFQACKAQASSALQRCTVTPWNRNCASSAPTCMPPPC